MKNHVRKIVLGLALGFASALTAFAVLVVNPGYYVGMYTSYPNYSESYTAYLPSYASWYAEIAVADTGSYALISGPGVDLEDYGSGSSGVETVTTDNGYGQGYFSMEVDATSGGYARALFFASGVQ